MEKKKEMLALYVVLVACVAAALFCAVSRLRSESDAREKIDGIEIDDVDFSTVPDGSYLGECDTDMVCARVRVTVKDGRVLSIDLLEHDNERGGEAEVVPSVIVAQQDLDVDAVTGATESSKVILKAVERALLSARRSCPMAGSASAAAESSAS